MKNRGWPGWGCNCTSERQCKPCEKRDYEEQDLTKHESPQEMIERLKYEDWLIEGAQARALYR